MGAFIGLFLIIVILAYVYFALALLTIAKKTKTKNEWLAWIPIANMYLMTQIAKVPWWTLLIVLFAGVIPYIGTLVAVGITVWWWWKIAEARKYPGWFGILMLIPLVNFVVIGIIAWKDH